MTNVNANTIDLEGLFVRQISEMSLLMGKSIRNPETDSIWIVREVRDDNSIIVARKGNPSDINVLSFYAIASYMIV